ncbi:hypothetical protein Btru_072859 [Bulinus truncatus]|nr:hypothetical protein Btru_072859 [Bulinus truncatus]
MLTRKCSAITSHWSSVWNLSLVLTGPLPFRVLSLVTALQEHPVSSPTASGTLSLVLLALGTVICLNAAQRLASEESQLLENARIKINNYIAQLELLWSLKVILEVLALIQISGSGAGNGLD